MSAQKRTIAVTLKLTEESAELFKNAGVALYGEDHPVPKGIVIRELAKRAARELVKTKTQAVA